MRRLHGLNSQQENGLDEAIETTSRHLLVSNGSSLVVIHAHAPQPGIPHITFSCTLTRFDFRSNETNKGESLIFNGCAKFWPNLSSRYIFKITVPCREYVHACGRIYIFYSYVYIEYIREAWLTLLYVQTELFRLPSQFFWYSQSCPLFVKIRQQTWWEY